MTTICGRIYHHMADITPIDRDPTKPELISCGWTADILINGSTFASRPGLAWKFHPLRHFANQRPLPTDHNG